MKVQLSGRLGNQLFEIAHGFARSEEISKSPEFIWDIYSYPEGLSRDVLDIPGIKLQQDNKYGLLLKSLDKIRRYSTNTEEVLCKFLRIEREHNSDRFSHPTVITGYFQDFRWAEMSYLKLNELLTSMSLTKRYPESDSNIPDSYQVFHYRCGDYLNHQANFGVLSREYYLRNMLQGLPVVVVTDSLERAIENFGSIKNVQFIDPSKSSAWHAITIISRAAYVVSSNSTLSWWGAFFASKSGGTAVIPKPFFANENAVNLYYPEFKTAQAHFD